MIAIDTSGLSKVYRIYESPGHRLKEIILRRPMHTAFYALRDITFTLAKGETLGIIGENGAGKSTLLKILANTLKPTSGDLTINGRTSALLELGAGFNPELTGEENIYLTAYLMGLSKGEVDRKKAGVIEFSELGDFIWRPVKTYSSGMHVRLAFSIATSVDPDVLIIDEALSVGDQHFQKKCVDRMVQFRNEQRTIVFCSHNLYLVQELCKRTLWLDHGVQRMLGKTGDVISEYQNYVRGKDFVHAKNGDSEPEGPVKISTVTIHDGNGRDVVYVSTFQPLVVTVTVSAKTETARGHLAFALVRNDEEVCFATGTHFDKHEAFRFRDGMKLRILFPCLNLLNGIYFFRVALADETGLHGYHTISTQPFTVQTQMKELGMFFVDHRWEIDVRGYD